MSKSVFDVQCCRTLTLALAGLSCFISSGTLSLTCSPYYCKHVLRKLQKVTVALDITLLYITLHYKFFNVPLDIETIIPSQPVPLEFNL